MISFAVIGGILLNFGAYLTFKGKIYESVIAYLFADMCWVFMAYERDDYWGMLSVSLGVAFAFLAFLKMRGGQMSKTLHGDGK
ncbi:MAG: hypothetical protein RBR59_07020 [Sulfurimonadaceae bacterium]|nr:hypothetical protein [Sulfurimonadaceae bacterium]